MDPNVPLHEPQKTSTPKMNGNEINELNDTVVAGHLHVKNENTFKKTETATVTTDAEVLPDQPKLKFTNKPLETENIVKPKACKQISINSRSLPQPTEQQDKSHNNTYCKEWLSKMDYHDQLSLTAQNSPPSEQMSASSFNLSSVSHKVPESQTTTKFVSQRLQVASSSKVKNKENITWYELLLYL